jgi:tetratricopeptide (TPR) repeat protein
VSLLKALDAQPDNARSWTRLGDLYRSILRMDLACSAYETSLELDPYDHSTHESFLQTLLEMGLYDEAIAKSKRLLKQSPTSIVARDVLSVAYLQRGMLDKAIRITDEMIRLDPTDPSNHFKKAVLFQQKGEVGMAIKEYARVIEMAPESSLGDQSRQAMASLDSYQIRQIVSLAAEDNVFRTKLIRDAESAALEKGFVLSYTGVVTLRQISFDTPSEFSPENPPQYYHYH